MRRKKALPQVDSERCGAGIVAGASDNDPTTVATLAVIGSTTTYELGWLTLLVIPMLAVMQASRRRSAPSRSRA